MTMIQHQLSEIKRFKTKTYCPVTQLQKLNRALAEIANETDSHMRAYLINRYHQSLDLYHVNGRAGSLLPKEEEAIPAQAGTTADQVIAAANAAYEAYAKRIPYGCGGTVEDTAVYHQTFRALVGAVQ